MSQNSSTGGRKFDGDKLEYGLIPPLALQEMVRVLTFGCKKYERDNWKKVPESKRRYFDALERHLWAWKMGEQLDPESGMHHLVVYHFYLSMMLSIRLTKPNKCCIIKFLKVYYEIV